MGRGGDKTNPGGSLPCGGRGVYHRVLGQSGGKGLIEEGEGIYFFSKKHFGDITSLQIHPHTVSHTEGSRWERETQSTFLRGKQVKNCDLGSAKNPQCLSREKRHDNRQ